MRKCPFFKVFGLIMLRSDQVDLVEEELLAPEMARKLLGWKHSGFSVYNGKPLRRDDAEGLERVARYTRLLC